MPNTFVTEISYNLLIVVEFLLNIVYCIFSLLIFVLKLSMGAAFNRNMVETVEKRKRNSDDLPNKPILNRGNIDANWQKLLSSTLMMENITNEDSKERYTGLFRRTRKNKGPNQTSGSFNNNKTNNSQIENIIQNSLNLENKNNSREKSRKNYPPKATDKNKTITRFIAMDCEMVGVGYDAKDHMLARVSLVNKFGDCIYDKFVKPQEEVKDYRTKVSGVRREDLTNGEDFTTVQKEVSEILKGRILVGHSLKHDLSVLFLSHPKKNIRDTSKYKPFRSVTKGSTPSLKRLAKEILGVEIQGGEHSSVEDARAAMQLYCMVAKTWEQMMSEKRGGYKVVYE